MRRLHYCTNTTRYTKYTNGKSSAFSTPGNAARDVVH
jgi:hypothetical protein